MPTYAGTYIKVITDADGKVIGSQPLLASDVSLALGFDPLNSNNSAVSANKLATPRAIGMRGDVGGQILFDGSEDVVCDLSLMVLNNAGTYTKVITDAKGRVVSGQSLSGSDITAALGFAPVAASGTVSMASSLATPQELSFTGDVLGDVAFDGSSGVQTSLTLSPVGNAGTYTKVVTDASGRVSEGSNLSQKDITDALGYTPANAAVLSSDFRYETGSWTPGLTCTTPGDFSYNISSVSGDYRIIGDICYISFSLVCSVAYSTSTGYFYITGLPYTVGNYGTNYAISPCVPNDLGSYPNGASLQYTALTGTTNMGIVLFSSGIPASLHTVISNPSGYTYSFSGSGWFRI